MSKKINHVGIDVSSSELVIELKSAHDNSVSFGTFENTTSGHKKLLKFITKNSRHAKVCMEATGVYHVGLAIMLSKSDKTSVMVVNPRAMKNFGSAMLQRSKTDKVDAHIILEYLLRMDFIEWVEPPEVVQKIQALSRRLFQLKQATTREKNRSHAADFKGDIGNLLKENILIHIEQLESHIIDIQAAIVDLVQSDNTLNEKYALLISVKGISEVSAIQIIADV